MKPVVFVGAAVGLIVCLFLVSCESGDGGAKFTGSGGSESTGSATGSVGSGAGGQMGLGGGFVVPDAGDSDANPCAVPNPPKNCMLVPSGPACGDGVVNQPSEQCDDGNTVPGDGCNGICQIEPGYTCPPKGGPCTSDYVCGNGIVDPGEVCDDGDTTGMNGCSSDCLTVEPGWACPPKGGACTKLYVCGDGRINPGEQCDDGNTVSGDGCSSTCQLEPGWECPVPGTPCEPAPRCGDGILQPSIGEQCDDGNTVSGDGCSSTCTIEPGWICPTPDKPCVDTVKCGDGKIEGNEQCDDGNTVSGDGCSSTCTLEPGYVCPIPNSPCVPKCGDGIVTPPEQCDDGNTVSGDGCSSTCRWESGWACTGPAGHYTCHPTVCGDGVKEGTEGCDPGTGPGGIHDTGNGCSPTCTLEPNCNNPGGVCTSTCGDGIVLPLEQCDDGNTVDGDGCSSTCQIEPGWQCAQPPLGATISVPVVYRDFNARGDTNGYIDFNPGATGQDAAITGLVAAKLDSLGKPVYAGSGGGSQAAGFIQSVASYAQWYRDDPGQMGAINRTIVDQLTLYQNGSGGYVNRWGPNGEQWTISAYNNIAWCSNSSNACSTCTVPAGYTCLGTCTPWNNTQTCVAQLTTTAYDGNPVFFPIDPVSYVAAGPNHTAAGALLMSPVSPYELATIAPAYGGNWNDEPNGTNHNFNFTSEIRYWFLYDATQTYELDFTGDDDVWVFLNRTLAVDLGGIHTPQSGSVTISSATASQWGLTSGNLYEIAVFQDERQTTSSTFKLTLSGFNLSSSVCAPVCGNDIVTPPEQCDNGAANAVGYGNCQPNCTWGPYCGDGIVNGPEQCDNGINLTAYSLTQSTGCAPGCVLPPYCGDGTVQTIDGEYCDDGTANNTGAYGGCTSTCQRAPWCGDGIVNGPEQCDDGKNDGSYDTCAPGCVLGPRCGDGVVQPGYESCDDGAKNGTPGDPCSLTCQPVGTCGDGVVEPPEQCDDGTNQGGYGMCAPGCVYGPRCGDGIVQKPYEQCDDGPPNGGMGGYGECAPGCVFGPYCGDGVVQPGYEECDDGSKNGTPGDMCSSGCKTEVSVPQ
jgi:fibro-slime domain-containing protein